MLENNKKNVMIKSKYTDTVDRNLPLPEYPRPLLQRDGWINLNGKYEYAVLARDVAFPDAFPGEILVPFCIESPLSGVCRPLLPDEKLWYKRTIRVPKLGEGDRLLLHFEAVDYIAETFINQTFVGRHVGGYLPFHYDITDLVVPGMNELIVGVTDPTDHGRQERGKQVLEPKGIWYTATSGIWQTVWMEVVSDVRVADLKIITDWDHSQIRIKPSLTQDDAKVKLTIRHGKKTIVQKDIDSDCFNIVPIPDCQSWSPEQPFLYDVLIEVRQEAIVKDKVKSYFGMRKIEIRKDDHGYPRILLNGKPYFQTGVLDQGYYPDGLLTQPCDQALQDDIQAMKDLGFNMLRKHIKIESERWYYHCDRLGMLVWQDMPSGGDGYIGDWLAAIWPNLLPGLPIRDDRYATFKRADATGRSEFLEHLTGMIDHLFNHPSIVCWVPFNEAWGQFDAKKTAAFVKSIDPSRLVDHASGWYDQGGPDLISRHRYILKLKAPRPDGRRPFVLSEFGGYSQIIPDHVWNPSGSFGYRMYNTPEAITAAYAKLINEQVLPLVKAGLCATVYTQLSDVELEVNGLLTYDRERTKIDARTVRELNTALKAIQY